MRAYEEKTITTRASIKMGVVNDLISGWSWVIETVFCPAYDDSLTPFRIWDMMTRWLRRCQKRTWPQKIFAHDPRRHTEWNMLLMSTLSHSRCQNKYTWLFQRKFHRLPYYLRLWCFLACISLQFTAFWGRMFSSSQFVPKLGQLIITSSNILESFHEHEFSATPQKTAPEYVCSR